MSASMGEYIGDGVYVKEDQGDIVLSTERYNPITGELTWHYIWLEPQVWDNLLNFVENNKHK